jgi:dTDP-4-dehydrorhamnose reductase
VTRTILVLGRTGQVARELDKLGPPPGCAFAFAGRAEFDQLVRDDAEALIDLHRPAVVINASAYTAVDKAESEPEAAYRLNRDMPGRFARACTDRDTPFLHFSTDYVFDGTKPVPYVETDPRNPQSVYGSSKAEGETEVEGAGGRAVILRTSWVYSAFGANFIKTMLRLGQSRPELGVVADQLGRPTWAEDCAAGALHVARAMIDGDPRALGVFHLSGAGDASWADFAEAIFDESARRGGPRPKVNRITTADYPTPAKRPANSRLDTMKLERALGWKARPWRDSLKSCFDELESSPA